MVSCVICVHAVKVCGRSYFTQVACKKDHGTVKLERVCVDEVIHLAIELKASSNGDNMVQTIFYYE